MNRGRTKVRPARSRSAANAWLGRNGGVSRGFQRGWPPLLGKGRLEVCQKGSLGIASPSRRPRSFFAVKVSFGGFGPATRFERVTFAFGGQGFSRGVSGSQFTPIGRRLYWFRYSLFCYSKAAECSTGLTNCPMRKIG